MAGPTIADATHEERLWAGRLMASSEPWITLGRGEDACRAAALDPAYVTLVARGDSAPLGFDALPPARGRGFSVPRVHRGRSGGARPSASARRSSTAGEARFPARAGCSCASRTFNPRARALYERSGYRFVGALPDYVVDGFAEHLMVKRLA